VHDTRGQVLASTVDLEAQIPGSVPQVVRVLAENNRPAFPPRREPEGLSLHVPLLLEEKPIGGLTLSHDASYIDVRLEEIWRHNLIRF